MDMGKRRRKTSGGKNRWIKPSLIGCTATILHDTASSLTYNVNPKRVAPKKNVTHLFGIILTKLCTVSYALSGHLRRVQGHYFDTNITAFSSQGLRRAPGSSRSELRAWFPTDI